MADQSGATLFAMIVGVLLAGMVAWGVAGAYRRRMVALMRGGTAPHAERPVSSDRLALPLAAAASAARSRSQSTRRAALSGGSFRAQPAGRRQPVVAGPAFRIRQRWQLLAEPVLVLGAVYAWPMVITWGLVLRWPWGRVVGGIALYMVAMSMLVMLTSNADRRLPEWAPGSERGCHP